MAAYRRVYGFSHTCRLSDQDRGIPVDTRIKYGTIFLPRDAMRKRRLRCMSAVGHN